MKTRPLRRGRLGLGLVTGGLVVQAGAALFWSPGAFILSAAIGAPLVVAGALTAWLALRRAARDEAAG